MVQVSDNGMLAEAHSPVGEPLTHIMPIEFDVNIAR
jgi:hypothetical protein